MANNAMANSCLSKWQMPWQTCCQDCKVVSTMFVISGRVVMFTPFLLAEMNWALADPPSTGIEIARLFIISCGNELGIGRHCCYWY